MCAECDALVDEAEQIVLLAEAEQLVILEEAKQGVNVPDARRPLFPHEVRARVRFGDMNESLNHAERLHAEHITTASQKLVDEILNLIPAEATPAEAGAALNRIIMHPPETVQAILNDLEGNIAQVLASVRVFGHEAVVEEANQQGIEFSGLAGDGYLKKALDRAKAAAASVATSVWTTVTGRANAAIVNSYEVARPVVREAVLDPGIKKPLDEARQVTHDQHNAGRKDGAEEVPDPPARIYAGELLDGNTCSRCYDIDGYVFESEEEAEQWYPNGGPMAYCLGGNRCRGTLIYDWSDLGEDFDGGVDKDTTPRLPLQDANTPNTTGLPPRPDRPIVRPPIREDMPAAGKKAFEDYYRLPKMPFDKDDLEVSFKGRFVTTPGGVVVTRGGHGHSAKLPKKTRLPKSWTADDMRRAIQSVIDAPGAIGFSGNTWLLFGEVNGIVFHVRIGPDVNGELRIFHAYPLSGPGVRELQKDGRDVSKPGVQIPHSKSIMLYYNDPRLEGNS